MWEGLQALLVQLQLILSQSSVSGQKMCLISSHSASQVSLCLPVLESEESVECIELCSKAKVWSLNLVLCSTVAV